MSFINRQTELPKSRKLIFWANPTPSLCVIELGNEQKYAVLRMTTVLDDSNIDVLLQDGSFLCFSAFGIGYTHLLQNTSPDQLLEPPTHH